MGMHRRAFTHPIIPRALAILSLSACFVIATVDEASAQLIRHLYASGFSVPLAFVQDPSDPSVQYVVQQTGRIIALRNGVPTSVFLDLSGSVLFGGEQGLLGLAFPPDYATSGRFYVYFSAPSSGEAQICGTNPATLANHSTVARFKRSAANPLVADPSTRKDMVWSSGLPYIEHPFANHNGGNMAFGPDGFLYIGTGDGGSGDDPCNNSQTLSSFLGKMLRIDVSVPDNDAKGFRVPLTNPFQPGNRFGARPEIWDVGLRNPWRWSFDNPALGGTGALVIGDVGQGSFEEVDYEPSGTGGRNFGWSIREGAHAHLNRPAAFLPLIDPIHDYDHSFGNSITGGFVYRGNKLGPAFRGRYFFADFGSGRVWSLGLIIDGNREAHLANVVEHTSELGSLGNISSFGADANGELYIVDYSGRIFAIDKQPAIAGDFDADRRTDLVVRRSSDNTWYVAKSSTNYGTFRPIVFGNAAAGDMPLSADIDGDGIADPVTFRPSTGRWSWLASSTGFDPAQVGGVNWGINGDVPMLADMDGDGRADIVVWRPSSGQWLWLTSSTGFNPSQFGSAQFGVSALGDRPMLADMDGDGKADIMVWRASQQAWWYWLKSSLNFAPSQFGALAFGSGPSGDVPLTGDFDGDGKADAAIWRPGPGMYVVALSSTGFNTAFSRQLGGLGDRPLIGDFDGDNIADLAVWRPSNGTWFWLTSSAGWTGGFARPWGAPALGDVPVIK